jgi:hypothetical protein
MPAAAPPKRRPPWGLICLGVEVTVFLILKLYAVHPHRADEGIYFYDALRLTQGARLYRDLFFAHPPLHLLLPTLLTWIFGYHFTLLKMIPQLAGAIEGVLVFLIAKRVFQRDVAAVAASTVLLFAEDFLKSSSYLTGITEADALLCGAILLAMSRRPLVAGVLAGCATMTLLQTAPVVGGFGLALLLWDRKDGLRYAAGFVAPVALVHAWFGLRAGGDFFAQVYGYHLHKVGGGGMNILQNLVADDLTLFVGGALGLALFFREQRAEARRFLQALGPIVLVQIVAMVTRPRVFPFYFQPLFPLLALGLGWAFSEGVERARTGTGNARLAGVALAVTVALVPTVFRGPLTSLVSSKRAEQHETYAMTYVWRPVPIGPLDDAVQALWFHDGLRQAGVYYSSPSEYLWNMSRGFDSYDALVEAVQKESPARATLFGDSSTLPLVALGAGRRIALDFADTNVQRFTSGATAAEDAVAQLEADPPTLVLAIDGGGFASQAAFASWIAQHYRAIRILRDGDGTRYTLYHR